MFMSPCVNVHVRRREGVCTEKKWAMVGSTAPFSHTCVCTYESVADGRASCGRFTT